MQTDDFEKRLQRQPWRPAPAAWREEILQAAAQARAEVSCSAPAMRPAAGWLKLFWALRPHPVALAGAWLVILGLRLFTPATPEPAVTLSSAACPEMAMAQREQQRLLAELTEPAWEQRAAPAKTFMPRPRSALPTMKRPVFFGARPRGESRLG